MKILDLFAGAGGLSLGFELIRNEKGEKVFDLYRAVEIDKYACKTLIRRYGKKRVIQGDLTSKDIHQKVIASCKGVISIVIGGIPCQSFSLIGPRSGYGKKMKKFKNDQRDHLYLEFKKIVNELNPNIIVIENVKGILSKKDAKGRKIIDNIISDFGKNYTFNNTKNEMKYLLLNAADYGVPQRRERVILVGINKRWKNAKVPYPNPTHTEEPLKNKGLLPYITLFDAIGDLPKVSSKITRTSLKLKQINQIEKKNMNAKIGMDKITYSNELLNRHLARIGIGGKRFFEFVRPNGYKFLDHHIARSHQYTDILLFKHMKQGETAKDFSIRKPKMAKKLIKYSMDTFLDKYRKQHWKFPSTTVFAHLEKDGNRFIHPEQQRTITPREAARLQSFPDDYIFEGPLNKKFKQIGNAVPPLLAKSIAESISTLFDLNNVSSNGNVVSNGNKVIWGNAK
jgi:DNA (cytosine-5)-methyltransferase 1